MLANLWFVIYASITYVQSVHKISKIHSLCERLKSLSKAKKSVNFPYPLKYNFIGHGEIGGKCVYFTQFTLINDGHNVVMYTFSNLHNFTNHTLTNCLYMMQIHLSNLSFSFTYSYVYFLLVEKLCLYKTHKTLQV